MKWPLGMLVPVQDSTPFSPYEPPSWKGALKKVRSAAFDGVELAITDPAKL